jgi:hypothetical protein
MAPSTDLAELRSVNPATLEGFRGMAGLLYGQGLGRMLGSAWRHRRGMLALGRRYFSRL